MVWLLSAKADCSRPYIMIPHMILYYVLYCIVYLSFSLIYLSVDLRLSTPSQTLYIIKISIYSIYNIVTTYMYVCVCISLIISYTYQEYHPYTHQHTHDSIRTHTHTCIHRHAYIRGIYIGGRSYLRGII